MGTGRPPGRPRKDGLPAGSVPKVLKPLACNPNGQPRDIETGVMLSPYTEEDKRLAVTCYFVAGPTHASEMWRMFRPDAPLVPWGRTIQEWARDGISPDPQLAHTLVQTWRERAQFQFLREEEMTHKLASEKIRDALEHPDPKKDSMWNRNGVLIGAREGLSKALHPPHQTGVTVNMPGATFIRSDGKPAPKWDVEGEVVDHGGS